MGRVFLSIVLIFVASCGEKLLEKPKDLIPKERMILILKDFSILNSARNTNIGILHNHKIEPTDFIFSKYGIDSLQFAASDNYYASLPGEYEAMYMEIKRLLENEKERISEAKKIKDSLELQRNLKKSPIERRATKTSKDSLP